MQITWRKTAALLGLAAALLAPPAQAHWRGGVWLGPGWVGPGWYGPGYGWPAYWRPGVRVGVGIGLGALAIDSGTMLYPGDTWGEPLPPAYYEYRRRSLHDSLVSRKPDPVIEPQNAQSWVQTEADQQDCNRWATTQPAALADAREFQRSTLACMASRGYTVRDK
jgi:hypothetical protein